MLRLIITLGQDKTHSLVGLGENVAKISLIEIKDPRLHEGRFNISINLKMI